LRSVLAREEYFPDMELTISARARSSKQRTRSQLRAGSCRPGAR
jgi:hypothetical protein